MQSPSTCYPTLHGTMTNSSSNKSEQFQLQQNNHSIASTSYLNQNQQQNQKQQQQQFQNQNQFNINGLDTSLDDITSFTSTSFNRNLIPSFPLSEIQSFGTERRNLINNNKNDDENREIEDDIVLEDSEAEGEHQTISG